MLASAAPVECPCVGHYFLSTICYADHSGGNRLDWRLGSERICFRKFTGFLGWVPCPRIYGLGGVLLAHVFLNAPLMLRVLTGSLAGIPASQWRLSSQWGLSPLQRFQLIEWPAIRRVIPGLLALVFLVCFTSFSLVLMLGGGPSVTTLEVSIYTALRFDFNLPLAALLSCFQLGICSLVVLIWLPLQVPRGPPYPTFTVPALNSWAIPVCL